MATKITYATLGGDSLEELHRELDAAIAAAPETFAREHLLFINGKHLKSDAQFDDRSPIDTNIALGTFQKGHREHVKSAVAAARAAYPAWAALPWRERLAYVRRIADAIRGHRYQLSALMGY
jgi:delta 1-pyrroline-5-carboxylate dehydrogenase